MNQREMQGRVLLLTPGVVCAPAGPARLCAVTAAGVAVTVFDRARRRGGMGHYLHPRRSGVVSTPHFAAPALASLVDLFRREGSRLEDLETFLYGGAENPDAPGFDAGRGARNVQAGLEILERLGVPAAGTDAGGRWGRKVAFFTATGEAVTARVTTVRAADWYPPVAEARCDG